MGRHQWLKKLLDDADSFPATPQVRNRLRECRHSCIPFLCICSDKKKKKGTNFEQVDKSFAWKRSSRRYSINPECKQIRNQVQKLLRATSPSQLPHRRHCRRCRQLLRHRIRSRPRARRNLGSASPQPTSNVCFQPT